MSKGSLYMLPVPIAENALEICLPRKTIEKARGINNFLAENAKTARAFLKQLGHPKPIRELNIEEIGHQPDETQIDHWLAPIEKGEDVAVVSESGCPGIADPGAQIVRRAHRKGIRVIPLVGPSSLLLALMASGLDGQKFRFCGYLPIKEPERKDEIQRLEELSLIANGETELFIETPYRNNAMLEDLTKYCKPTTFILVASDITGPNELIQTRTTSEWRHNPVRLPKIPTVFGLLATKSKVRD